MASRDWTAAAKSIEGATFVRAICPPADTEGRLARYAARFPEFAAPGAKAAVIVTRPDESGDMEIEYIAVAVSDSDFSVPTTECAIMMNDIAPTQLIEYRFPEDATGSFRLGTVSRESYEMTLAQKFDAWKKMFVGGDCEAALRRMIRNGLPATVFCNGMFPTPDAYRATYAVTDEKTGKEVLLPHPIAEARVWDASSQAYAKLSVAMVGVPTDEAARKALWESLLTEVRGRFGDDVVDNILKEQAAAA